MAKRGGSLFKPPRHKWIADIVTFENPEKARVAARKLVNYIKMGRKGDLRIGQARALAIVRALNYSANRARASAKRKNLSAKERKELREIARIYRRAYERAAKIYERKFG